MGQWQDADLAAWLDALQGLSWAGAGQDAAMIEASARSVTALCEGVRGQADALAFERQPADFPALFEAIAVPQSRDQSAGEKEGWAAEPAATAPGDDDLTGHSLTELAGAIAGRRVSSREATEAALAALSRAHERLNIIAGVDEQAALTAADAADEDLARHGPVGRLHGVPLAHKDMFYRAGRNSACGSNIFADFVPDHTATALRRLDDAGALDVARLNMVEIAYGTTGHNTITGNVGNPWNPDHITGGSSSGPGAAVGAWAVTAALGSDTGGSIRLPAACCGTVGLKATTGRVSRFGAMPLCHSLDTVGPLARTVSDTALMLSVIAGHDAADPVSSRRAVPDYFADLEQGVEGLRIAVPENYFYDPVSDEVGSVLQASLDIYAKLGAELVPVEIPGIKRANILTTVIIMAEAAGYHRQWLGDRRDDYSSQIRSRLIPGLAFPATAYIEALNLRRTVLAQFAESVFDKADLLHLPMLPIAVPRYDALDEPGSQEFIDTTIAIGHCTRPANYMGLPALSMPAGQTPDGLPAAFQLIGRPFDEAGLLRTARAFERETAITDRRPEI